MLVWIRSPKVYKRQGGNIVNIWQVKKNRHLDPVLVMRQYLCQRY